MVDTAWNAEVLSAYIDGLRIETRGPIGTVVLDANPSIAAMLEPLISSLGGSVDAAQPAGALVQEAARLCRDISLGTRQHAAKRLIQEEFSYHERFVKRLNGQGLKEIFEPFPLDFSRDETEKTLRICLSEMLCHIAAGLQLQGLLDAPRIAPSAAEGAANRDLRFDREFRARLLDLLVWRRDVRRFKRDGLPQGTLERLVDIACLAPSVGLSQPWRFVSVESPSRRAAARASFERCNADALRSQAGDRAALYARLKLAGLDDAPVQFAVFVDAATDQGHGLGRRTMPATTDYSAVMAVHSLWLVARAEGIGLGWVSIIDPEILAAALDVPSTWSCIGYFCLGYPVEEDDVPALERQGWETRRPSSSVFVVR